MAGRDPHDATPTTHTSDSHADQANADQTNADQTNASAMNTGDRIADKPRADPPDGQPKPLSRAPGPAPLRAVSGGRDLVALNRRQPSTPQAAPASGPSDTSDGAAPGADALDPDRILELPARRPATPKGTQPPDDEQRLPPRIARILPVRPGGPRGPSLLPPGAPGSGAAPRLPSGPALGPASGPLRAPMVALRDAAHPYLARLNARRTAGDTPPTGDGDATTGSPVTPARADQQDDQQDATPAPSACPHCHGAGFVRLDVPVGDKLFGHAVRCECKEREIEARERQKLRDLSSLKPFDKKTFETFDTAAPGVAEAYTVARRYADDPSGWLILQGGYGCGKTHLAAAIAHVREDAGETVFFSIAPDLLDHLRATFAPASEITYDELFDRVRHVGLLALDDLGSENATAWATEKLFQIINYRYNYRLPTVITTNVRLLSHLDDRIRSRLSDLSLVRWVAIEAPDYRERHAGHAGQGGATRPPRGGGPPRGRGYGR